MESSAQNSGSKTRYHSLSHSHRLLQIIHYMNIFFFNVQLWVTDLSHSNAEERPEKTKTGKLERYTQQIVVYFNLMILI